MKKSHVVILVFMVIAIGAVIATLYQADTYATFDEARQQPGKNFQIIGQLVREMPILEEVRQNTLLLTFFLADQQGDTCKVYYPGARPQDFEKSDQVVLIGQYREDIFVANSLLLKCPSKYNPEDLGMQQTSFQGEN